MSGSGKQGGWTRLKNIKDFWKHLNARPNHGVKYKCGVNQLSGKLLQQREDICWSSTIGDILQPCVLLNWSCAQIRSLSWRRPRRQGAKDAWGKAVTMLRLELIWRIFFLFWCLGFCCSLSMALPCAMPGPGGSLETLPLRSVTTSCLFFKLGLGLGWVRRCPRS